MPAPTTAIRSPIRGGASHNELSAVSTNPCQHGALRRHLVGYRGDGSSRDAEQGLVRIQAEDGAAHQLRRAFPHPTDIEVPVLDGSGKVALLERSTHGRVLTRRHPAEIEQRFRAAADRRVLGLYYDLVGISRRAGGQAGPKSRFHPFPGT
ncbi:hypothetical protein GCM10010252_14360 [Streptomyces aureoverticillatus]|nr:hypothetical protein GCM10010252_14360 [Streptomyces aureoverticillatus]